MATLDLTSPAVLPLFSKAQTPPTIGHLRRVDLPPGHGGLVVSLRPVTTDAKIVTLGAGALVADDTDIGAATFGPVDHDLWSEVYFPVGCEAFYLASTGASVDVYVSLDKPRPL